MSNTTDLPDGWGLKPPEWHFEKFVEFTRYKQEIGEPSPHLAVVGNICEKENLNIKERLWLIGNYGCSYCLPTAQVTQSIWNYERAKGDFAGFDKWLKDNWPGIVTRTERRAVRTHPKYSRCLREWIGWIENGYPEVLQINEQDDRAYYDEVYKSVTSVYSIGRYIAIRMIEGMKRYCGLPRAQLYDVRSIGGWSPKKCLAYLYPQHAKVILIDNKEGNILTDQLAEDLLSRVQQELPWVDYYIVAAMLCEYKGAYEKKHQYVGWTIDQEPLLYDKVIRHFGKQVEGISEKLWSARKSLHPEEVLGEIQKWGGTRWDIAKLLREQGYVWSDLRYDYWATVKRHDWARPVLREKVIVSTKRGLYMEQQLKSRKLKSSPKEETHELFPLAQDVPPQTTKPQSILQLLRSRHSGVISPPHEKEEAPRAKPAIAASIPPAENARKSINEIIPGQLYQRAQILSWKRHEKEQFLANHGIGLVINFWPKIDNDMGEIASSMYWHVPVPQSDNMVSGRIVSLAKITADMVKNESMAVLCLCEAGKTRSVFFAILVMSNLLGCSHKEAYNKFVQMDIGSKLRPSMIQYLNKE